MTASSPSINEICMHDYQEEELNDFLSGLLSSMRSLRYLLIIFNLKSYPTHFDNAGIELLQHRRCQVSLLGKSNSSLSFTKNIKAECM
jgi:hypothetical protein